MKYMEGEKFLEITFEIPNTTKIEELANKIKKHFVDAVNIIIIPCKIQKEPQRLSVRKKDHSYSVYNPKQKSQII